MSSRLIRLLLVVALVGAVGVSVVGAVDLQVGSSIGNVIAYSEDVKLSAIPFNTRTKNVFYNSDQLRVIKGVSAIDKKNSKASVTITSGGVGSTFVNVRLKSKRGDGLDYQVQIFV